MGQSKKGSATIPVELPLFDRKEQGQIHSPEFEEPGFAHVAIYIQSTVVRA
jgi:hypothetical protein